MSEFSETKSISAGQSYSKNRNWYNQKPRVGASIPMNHYNSFKKKKLSKKSYLNTSRAQRDITQKVINEVWPKRLSPFFLFRSPSQTSPTQQLKLTLLIVVVLKL